MIRAAGLVRRLHQLGERHAPGVGAADAAQPDGREIERFQKAREEARVAEADLERPRPALFGGFQRQRQDFRVGGFPVGAAEALEPRLVELARPLRPDAEHAAEIGEGRRAPGLAGGQVIEADGNGVFGPQAQLGARRVGGDVEAAANVLAREVEEDRRRLEDFRLGAVVARLDEMADEALEPTLPAVRHGPERPFRCDCRFRLTPLLPRRRRRRDSFPSAK